MRKTLLTLMLVLAISIPVQASTDFMYWKSNTFYNTSDDIYSLTKPNKDLKKKDANRKKSIDEILSGWEFALKDTGNVFSSTSSTSSTGAWTANGDMWNPVYHEFTDDIKSIEKPTIKRCAEFKSNLARYGYKSSLVSQSNKAGYDPYFVAAIITIESNGDPNVGATGTYVGLGQVTRSVFPNLDLLNPNDNINATLQSLEEKRTAMKGTSNYSLISAAYNAGQGVVYDSLNDAGIGTDKATLDKTKYGSYAKYMVKNARKYYNTDNTEKKEYFAKVLYAYNQLKSENVLG